MRNLLIVGAGGHTRSLIELLEQTGWMIEGILDNSFDPSKPEVILSYKILGNVSSYQAGTTPLIIGKGRLPERTEVYNSLKEYVLTENIIHPTAVVSKHAQLGTSNQIFSQAVLNAEVTIGNHNIINTSAVIEHNSVIGNYNHISVGTILCGKVSVGSNCFLGAGAVVIDAITITDNVTIGANSVVIKDILEPGLYVGNPARKVS